MNNESVPTSHAARLLAHVSALAAATQTRRADPSAELWRSALECSHLFERESSESVIFLRASGELSRARGEPNGLPTDAGAVVFSQDFATALEAVRSRCAPSAPVVGADSRIAAHMATLSTDDQAKVRRYVDLFNPRKEVK